MNQKLILLVDGMQGVFNHTKTINEITITLNKSSYT